MGNRIYSAGSTNHQVEVRDYGFIDKRRRKVGSTITTWEEKFIAVDADDDVPFYGSERCTPGYKFAARVHNTRDGSEYGASNRAQYFDTAAARQEYIDRYLVRSQKTLFKQFEWSNKP